MYSFSYMEPVCWSVSSSKCCFLTCIQVSQEAGRVIWYSHLFQNFPQFIVIHTVEGFGIVNKAEIDVFLELSCFFNDPADVGNLISGSSPFSKTSLNIWKFVVHVLVKTGLDNFEHYFTSVWDECYYHCLILEQFHHLYRNPFPINTHSLFPLITLFQSLPTTNVFFVSMVSSFLDISCKWHLASFTQQNIFKVHSFVCHYFISSYYWIILYCIYHILFIHSSVNRCLNC